MRTNALCLPGCHCQRSPSGAGRRRRRPRRRRRAAASRTPRCRYAPAVLLDRALYRRPCRLRLVGCRLAVRCARVNGHSGSGWLAGGQIGYNLQMRQFVFGVEADMSGAWSTATACPNAAFNCGHSFNWLASVRGRAGVAVNGNRTPALRHCRRRLGGRRLHGQTRTGANFGSGFSNTHFGWVAGAGIEHMLTPNVSAQGRISLLRLRLDDGACRCTRRRPRRARSQYANGPLRPQLPVLSRCRRPSHVNGRMPAFAARRGAPTRA